MNETQRILAEYDRVMRGNAWHGDPIWHILGTFSAESATQRPLAAAHSVWEIVMHMTFWEGVAAKRLSGQRAGLVEELNFPAPPEATGENWQRTLEEFRHSNARFREALSKMDAASLDDLSAAGKRSFYEEAHGLIEHNVYHAGQIAILQKAFPHK